MMLVLAVCVMLGGAVSASAYVVVKAAPFSSVTVGASCGGPVYGVPYGYVTTGVYVLPVTTAITYSPYVVTAYPAYPVMYYPAPYVYPRIVTVPTYAVIR